MERVDVLIVGGGPAGSSLAWGLRGSGLRVRVMDRARFPRDKTCAGWVTPPVWSALALEPSSYAAAGRTLQAIRGFRIGRMGDRSALACGDAVVSHGIRRCEFDAFLLARCGAEVQQGAAVRSVAPAHGGWLVNDAIHARLLVGAGGHFCPVARAVAQNGSAESPVAAQEIEAPLRDDELRALRVAEDVPEIWFTRDLAGYGWVFRKGRYLNVGLGRRGAGAAEQMRAFLAQLRDAQRVPASWRGDVHGHAYLTYATASRPLSGAHFALIGDAAGLAHDKSGEGIRPAVESGLLLARALAAAPDVAHPEALTAYASAVTARFGARSGGGAPAAVPSWEAALAGRLFATRWFARRVVVERWFLGTRQPRLAA